MDQFSSDADQNVRVKEGDAVILQLPPIASVPPPQMEWFRNKNKMDIYGPNHYVTLQNNLALLDVDMVSDGVPYHAEALNGQSGDNASSGEFILEVLGKFV